LRIQHQLHVGKGLAAKLRQALRFALDGDEFWPEGVLVYSSSSISSSAVMLNAF
jgi:hypothetical protein